MRSAIATAGGRSFALGSADNKAYSTANEAKSTVCLGNGGSDILDDHSFDRRSIIPVGQQ